MNRQLNERDFEKALDSRKLTGDYFLVEDYVLDFSFKDYVFGNCIISSGSFSGSIFENCKFNNVILKNVHLGEVYFKNCDFHKTTFEGCKTEGIQFVACTNIPKIV